MFEIFVVIAIIALAVASIVNVRSQGRQSKQSEPEIIIRLDEHTNAQQMREQLDQYRVTKVTQR